MEQSGHSKYGSEFDKIIRQAKHAANNPLVVDGSDSQNAIILKAIKKVFKDNDILLAGKIIFEEHLPVRVGVRYLLGFLMKMTGWTKHGMPAV